VEKQIVGVQQFVVNFVAVAVAVVPVGFARCLVEVVEIAVVVIL